MVAALLRRFRPRRATQDNACVKATCLRTLSQSLTPVSTAIVRNGSVLCKHGVTEKIGGAPLRFARAPRRVVYGSLLDGADWSSTQSSFGQACVCRLMQPPPSFVFAGKGRTVAIDSLRLSCRQPQRARCRPVLRTPLCDGLSLTDATSSSQPPGNPCGLSHDLTNLRGILTGARRPNMRRPSKTTPWRQPRRPAFHRGAMTPRSLPS